MVVIYFASFLQSCQSHYRFFTTLLRYNNTWQLTVLAWAKLFVFQRLYSTWQMQHPRSCKRGEKDRVKCEWSGCVYVCIQYRWADERMLSHICVWAVNEGYCLMIDWSDLCICISKCWKNIFNLFLYCPPPCYLHKLNLLLADCSSIMLYFFAEECPIIADNGAY